MKKAPRKTDSKSLPCFPYPRTKTGLAQNPNSALFYVYSRGGLEQLKLESDTRRVGIIRAFVTA